MRNMLAPDIVKAILGWQQPAEMTLAANARILGRITPNNIAGAADRVFAAVGGPFGESPMHQLFCNPTARALSRDDNSPAGQNCLAYRHPPTGFDSRTEERMALAELSSRDAVIATIEEFNELGRDRFFGPIRVRAVEKLRG